ERIFINQLLRRAMISYRLQNGMKTFICKTIIVKNLEAYKNERYVMSKNRSLLTKQNTIYYFTIVLISLLVSLTATMFTINSPFAEFSNNPLIDTLKISIFILISVLLLFFIVKNTSKSFISVIFIAFFVRIIVVFIMSFFGFIPYQYDNNWDLDAATLLSDWHSGNIHFNINNNKVSFYSGLTTVVYYLFGENPIYMQLLNVFFSTLAIIYLFKMSRYLFNYKVAFYSSVIMSIWPTYIFFTSMHMREALAIFFLLAFAYYFMKWLRYFKFKYIILAAFSFLFDMLIRPQN